MRSWSYWLCFPLSILSRCFFIDLPYVLLFIETFVRLVSFLRSTQQQKIVVPQETVAILLSPTEELVLTLVPVSLSYSAVHSFLIVNEQRDRLGGRSAQSPIVYIGYLPCEYLNLRHHFMNHGHFNKFTVLFLFFS